jgi:ABC-type nitrate/sulfonate/bicarbonate transport system substrate-binding protein
MVVALAAVMLGATGCGSANESSPAAAGTADVAEAATIRVASNSNASVLTMWVALEKGIFAKHGLDVKYTKVENIGTLPPAVGKSFDIVFVTPVQAIAATAQGIPLTEVAGSSTDTTQAVNSYLMVKKGSSITSLQGMKGKTIGVLTAVGTLHYATLNMLKKAGVEPSDVKIVQVDGPSQLAQLSAGRVDAVETLAPFSEQLKKNGAVNLGVPFESLSDSISVIWWAAGTEWAAKHADEATKFRESLAEAETFIEQNDAEARTVLQKYSGFPADVVKAFPLPDYDSSVRPQDLPIWLQVMKEVAGFKGNVDVSKLAVQP